MATTRRQFLTSALGASAVVSLSAAAPRFLLAAAAENAAAGDNVLVVVQLTGGNDGLNTIIPYADDAYRRNRETLAQPADKILKIDDHLAFHPAMRGMSQLLEAGKLAIVQGVGYPHPDRSHFTAMDIWQTANRQPDRRATGWLGRALDAAKFDRADDLPALHLGGEHQPLALAGRDVQVPSIRSLDRFRLEKRRDERLAETLKQAAVANRPATQHATTQRAASNDLLGFVRENTVSAVASSQRLEASLGKYTPRATYPSSELGQKLATLAQLIDAGLKTRIYYVELDGFDTHAAQGPAHAALLGQLSDAVAALLEDLTRHGHAERVLLATFSEFGRRVKENASHGTDHGAAAPMLLAGGKLRPGVIGKHPSLTDLDDGDLKFHTDFRQVYATLLEDWLGWKSQPVLGEEYARLPIVKA